MILVLAKSQKMHKYLERRPDGRGGWHYVYAANAHGVGRKPGTSATVHDLGAAHQALQDDIRQTQTILSEWQRKAKSPKADKAAHQSAIATNQAHLQSQEEQLAHIAHAMRATTQGSAVSTPVLSAYQNGKALTQAWRAMRAHVQNHNPRMSEAAAGAQAAALLGRLAEQELETIDERLEGYGSDIEAAQADPAYETYKWYMQDAPHRNGISEALADLSVSRTMYGDMERVTADELTQARQWLAAPPPPEAAPPTQADRTAMARQSVQSAKPHLQAIAQRMESAYPHFEGILTDLGYTPEQARKIHDVYLKNGAIKLDAGSGRYTFADGGLLDRDVLDRALAMAESTTPPKPKRPSKKQSSGSKAVAPSPLATFHMYSQNAPNNTHTPAIPPQIQAIPVPEGMNAAQRDGIGLLAYRQATEPQLRSRLLGALRRDDGNVIAIVQFNPRHEPRALRIAPNGYGQWESAPPAGDPRHTPIDITALVAAVVDQTPVEAPPAPGGSTVPPPKRPPKKLVGKHPNGGEADEPGHAKQLSLFLSRARSDGGQFARHGSAGHFRRHLQAYRQRRDAGEIAGTRDDYAAHVTGGWKAQGEDHQADLLGELRHLEADVRGMDDGPQRRKLERRCVRLRERLADLGVKVTK